MANALIMWRDTQPQSEARQLLYRLTSHISLNSTLLSVSHLTCTEVEKECPVLLLEMNEKHIFTMNEWALLFQALPV